MGRKLNYRSKSARKMRAKVTNTANFDWKNKPHLINPLTSLHSGLVLTHVRSDTTQIKDQISKKIHSEILGGSDFIEKKIQQQPSFQFPQIPIVGR